MINNYMIKVCGITDEQNFSELKKYPIDFFGFIFYKIKVPNNKPTIFEKILTILLGYLIIPLILSIPLYLSIYNLTFLNAFFESISGFPEYIIFEVVFFLAAKISP